MFGSNGLKRYESVSPRNRGFKSSRDASPAKSFDSKHGDVKGSNGDHRSYYSHEFSTDDSFLSADSFLDSAKSDNAKGDSSR